MSQLILPLGSNPRHTFANFCSDECPPVPAALAQLPERGGLIWLHGPTGCGKSHLLQASAYRMRDLGRTAAYLPLAPGLDASVLESFEGAALVCLDDLDAVLGESAWELRLFALVNQVLDRGAGLLLTSRTPPGQARTGLADLRSRLAGAASFALFPLREERQSEALRMRARSQGYDLPESVLDYLLPRARRDLGSLCKLLDQLEVLAFRARRNLTVPFVREVLAGRT